MNVSMPVADLRGNFQHSDNDLIIGKRRNRRIEFDNHLFKLFA